MVQLPKQSGENHERRSTLRYGTDQWQQDGFFSRRNFHSFTLVVPK